MNQKRMSKLQTALIIGASILTIIAILLITQRAINSTQTNEASNGIATAPKGSLRTVATNLETPWEISFLPEDDLLVTERSGRVQRIGGDGAAYEVAGVRETSEGGLLGIALHPDFNQNKYVYLYSTTDTNGRLTNRVQRYTLSERTLRDRTEILTDIPASANHDGGALAFGPDNKLYITTGDAGDENAAQDRQSLAGKILRINDDGSIPRDNPFNSAVWSYGHRNAQGIAWDDKNRLWATEHGRSGIQSGYDELNRIEKGANYGWPIIEGDETRDGMKTPVIHSGADDTWAPGGLAYADGSLHFTGLRGATLYQAKINSDDTVTLSRHLTDQYGRLRAIAIRNDELYFSTSNRDGRGSPTGEDDRIFAIRVDSLDK